MTLVVPVCPTLGRITSMLVVLKLSDATSQPSGMLQLMNQQMALHETKRSLVKKIE